MGVLCGAWGGWCGADRGIICRGSEEEEHTGALGKDSGQWRGACKSRRGPPRHDSVKNGPLPPQFCETSGSEEEIQMNLFLQVTLLTISQTWPYFSEGFLKWFWTEC